MKILVRSVVPLALLVGLSSCLSSCKAKSSAGAGEGGVSGDPAAGGSTTGILNGFEGEIGLLAKGSVAGKSGQPQQLTTAIKGDKVRLDIPPGMSGTEALGGKGYVVFNGGEKKLYIVSDPQKMVMVLDLNKTADSPLAKMGASPGKPGAPAKPPPKVTKTGKMDTVAGIKCETWQIDEEGKGKVGEACIAQEGFSWFSLPLAHLPTEHAWTAELMDGKHFPLRFIGYENGAESGRLEVTRIDKKTLPASEFEMPAGYKVMDLSQMMQGMPSGMPPGMPGMPPGVRPQTHH